MSLRIRTGRDSAGPEARVMKWEAYVKSPNGDYDSRIYPGLDGMEWGMVHHRRKIYRTMAWTPLSVWKAIRGV